MRIPQGRVSRLVYLDPPFNSNRNYNVLFRNESGTEGEAQITAFEDTWHWNLHAEETYNELIQHPDQVRRIRNRRIKEPWSFTSTIDQLGGKTMAHEVQFCIPERPLGRADATFSVKKDGRTLGTLTVSNGSLVWFPSRTSYGYKVAWQDFDRLMKDNATREEKR